MNQEMHSNAERIGDLVASLNEAYSSNQLDGYRVLELKESHDERTTCSIQWGPQMRT